jgi:hypothetical protein
MGSLYTFQRRLFWRRWQPKLSNLGQHFSFDLVQELYNSTLYKESNKDYLLYTAYISCIQSFSTHRTEITHWNKRRLIVHDLVHNLLSCNMSALDNSLLW